MNSLEDAFLNILNDEHKLEEKNEPLNHEVSINLDLAK